MNCHTTMPANVFGQPREYNFLTNHTVTAGTPGTIEIIQPSAPVERLTSYSEADIQALFIDSPWKAAIYDSAGIRYDCIAFQYCSSGVIIGDIPAAAAGKTITRGKIWKDRLWRDPEIKWPADIPYTEAVELAKLYYSTGGDGWTNHTNWFATNTAANWGGITVAGGKVTAIYLPGNNLVGDLSDFRPQAFTAIVVLGLFSNITLSGDLTHWSWPSTITNIRIYDNQFTKIPGGSLPSGIQYFYVYINQMDDDLSAFVIPAVARYMYFYDNEFISGPDLSQCIGLRDLRLHDNGLLQSAVDAVINAIYDRRNSYTWATPTLYIGGSNEAPSGEAIVKIGTLQASPYNWTISYTAP